jgi:phosphotriesterase-related protein
MSKLITTRGDLGLHDLESGIILPHEHIFVDMRVPDDPEHGQANVADVVALMQPELARAKRSGVAALVTCTPEGVGRRADIDRAVSLAADLPVLVPTGAYREPWIPSWMHSAPMEALRDWLISELEEGIGDTSLRAAWIKLSAGDDGLTPTERRLLRAAAAAGQATGAVIGSHTIKGEVVLDQLTTLQAAGYTPERFIWIHTQAEPDSTYHQRVAETGAWLEYDAIGSEAFSDEVFLAHIQRMIGAGHGHQILLSHDRGWYDPTQPGGGTPKPFTYISDVFLDKMRDAGLDAATVSQLTRDNPFRAFAR